MNSLFVTVLVALAAYASAGVIGPHGSGAIIAGPSGIVTPHGAIGPAGHGLGYDGLGGLGGWGGLGGLGYAGHGAVLAAPVAHSAVVAGPALGYGLGLGHGGLGGYAGYGGYGGYGHGLGLSHGAVVTNGGGVIGLSGHGVSVKGPETVPAVIAGPSGKIVADGLYGVPTHHGYHGGW